MTATRPSVRVRPLQGVAPIVAVARFTEAEHALVVDPVEPLQATNRVSIDALTLTFSSPPHVWIRLDAYTNRALWRSVDVELPSIDVESALGALGEFDRHGIGESQAADIAYAYSEQASLLLVRVAQREVVQRVRFLSCAICGLAANHELVEIWIDNLVVDG
jgi:hypothetical protein